MVIYEVKMKRQQLAPDFYIIINQMLFWRDKAGNKKMSQMGRFLEYLRS